MLIHHNAARFMNFSQLSGIICRIYIPNLRDVHVLYSMTLENMIVSGNIE